MANTATVLVTGGSGFIASWCIISLLERGYRVHTTVRDLSREQSVRTAIGTLVDIQDRLSFYAADLNADAGWNEAAEGCDYVLHVASPLGTIEPRNPDVLIRPAREGARRVIKAAIAAGAKRIVMTSSTAATSRGAKVESSVSDETHWTDVNEAGVSAYAKSKTLAERAAWELIANTGDSRRLATVNPALVLGPVLSRDFSDSVEVVRRLLSGRVPGIPRLGFNIVDVRDVAQLHILAMTAPEAGGQRFIAAGSFAWMSQIAHLLRANLGADAAHVPTRRIPDFVLRLAAIVDRQLGAVVPGLGKTHDYSSSKAERLLGWLPRPLTETVVDTARSLLLEGAL